MTTGVAVAVGAVVGTVVGVWATNCTRSVRVALSIVSAVAVVVGVAELLYG